MDITPINPEIVGESLYYLLTTKSEYNNFSDVYDNSTKDNSVYISLVQNSIKSVLVKNFNININFSNPSYYSDLLAGDILIVDGKRPYILAQVVGVETPITWPKLYKDDEKYFKFSDIKSFNLIRPDYNANKNTLSSIENISKEITNLESTTSRLTNTRVEELRNADKDITFEELGDGALQIGDLVFSIDPTQIAFNTQNGYQYFPTIRTQGNPKIPTPNQIKNISINLIFPNEDSINFQLLNLFAMFKRTPFVNLRNKDICSFFKEVCFMEEWLSIALESINIQSVQGFPNTLQASITILPFDYRTISTSFQGLLSMQDVERQQAILYKDANLDKLIRKVESKFNDQSIYYEKFIDIIKKDIKKSPDFRNSLPFRAFYQSLIAERSSITNSFGESISTNQNSSFNLNLFRPSDSNTLLHEYKASNNIDEISFEYSYIPKTFAETSKLISEQRIDLQIETLNQLNDLYNTLNKPDDLIKQIISVFVTEKEFFEITQAKFDQIGAGIIPTLLTRYGITINEQEGKPINNLFDLLIQGISLQIGLRGASETFGDLVSIAQGKISIDSFDIVGYKNGLIFNDTENNSVGTFEYGINQIWKWLDSGTDKQKEKKKVNFVSFLTELKQSIKKELGLIDTEQMISINPTSDGEKFKVNKLPIQRAKFVIDNKTDIIIGWSLIFSNKFIPVTLQAFKYPYYQHIGSEDSIISLNINSLSNSEFKSNLSLLSERIHETVKIVTFNAPELITYLDSRLTVTAGINNIFNCFGVKKVLFDTSNTVNINGQPGSWNTVVNFTQANFTIDQYHQVSRVPSDNISIAELAKILVCIDIEDDQIKIYDFKSKDGQDLTLNDLIRVRFIEWSYKQKNEDNIFIYIQSLINKEKTITGKEIAENYINEFRNYYAIRSINTKLTEEFNKLFNEKPDYKNVLYLINSKLDDLFKQRSSSIRETIYPNRSFFSNWWKSLKERLGGETYSTTGSGLLLLFTIIPRIASSLTSLTSFASISSAVSGSILLYNNALAIADATQIGIKDKLISNFGSIFSSIESAITTSVIYDFASKIIRDPVVYSNIIRPETIGFNLYEKINNNKILSKISCYNDFNLPEFSDIVIGPDFYLWNDLVDSTELQLYINESIKRYAKVGKLTSMMSLVEASEILEKYNTIINRAKTIDEEIKNNVHSILTTDIMGSSTTIGNLQETIDSLKHVRDLISTCENSTDELETVSENDRKLLDDFERLYKDKLSKEDYENSYKILSAKLNRSSEGMKIENMDLKRLNLIYTARMKTMLEIFEVYTVLNEYMIENKNLLINEYNRNINKSFESSDYAEMTTNVSNKNALVTMYKISYEILKNPLSLTQKNLQSKSWGSGVTDDIKELLIKKFNKGLADDQDSTYLSLPGIKNVQNFLFNKIGYYIRLNSFLSKYSTTGGRLDFSTLPELAFLSFWNYPEKEGNERKIKLVSDFANSYSSKKDTTIKMFPTFKIFFVEEDKNITSYNFNDYYTHNAIQSIEIVESKNSPGKTAVIKISNINNNLTDKVSLLRESEDIFGQSLAGVNSPNLFFGTLDIKPGTMIVVKMGYAPYDNLLVPLFQGRIIEMNAGSNVELICQSFGSQLNHEILQHKFGLFSKEREHGDVASALLDMIPGLEKLGKKNELGLLSDAVYDPRGLRNLTGKIGDKFLMSNILGNVSSLSFASINPRDENIYLEYSAANNFSHHPTFDWIVYDQTVWSSLKEICLYHRNKIPIVRAFNDNSFSSNNYLRETLVVGDKAGYYKCTDAFGLSSIDYKKIDQAVSDWNNLRNSLFGNNQLSVSSFQTINTYGSYNLLDGRNTETVLTLTKDGKNIFSFLQKPVNSAILQLNILKNNIDTEANANPLEILISKISDNNIIKNDLKELLTNLVVFVKSPDIEDDKLDTINFGDSSSYSYKFKLFNDIVKGLKKYLSNTDLIKEEYYNISVRFNNTDEELINNPQYKKIQQHHLITDSSDIISNNISLNSSFSNVVNVYYVDEPSFKTASLDKFNDNQIKNKLNLWTVKAFGDQKDEFSRVLNSYQKNIDTNWFDIVSATKGFYNKYTKANGEEAIKNLSKVDNIQTPNWNAFPSFVTVGVRLLQEEVSKMYQGTIEIVGNPNIRPYDILHIQDYVNDMHGVVEVEEVINIFTPDRGYITIITPNLITYDRDPIQLQDIQVINQIYDYASSKKLTYTGASLTLASLGLLTAVGSFSSSNPIIKVGGTTAGLLSTGFFLYNGLFNATMKYHKFLYDQMGNILGRDCINFTSLLYHGMPYIAGFDGVDYTNLKTLMNHKVADVKNPISRYLSYSDVFKANITTGWNPEEYDLNRALARNIPIISDLTGFGSSRLRSGITE